MEFMDAFGVVIGDTVDGMVRSAIADAVWRGPRVAIESAVAAPAVRDFQDVASIQVLGTVGSAIRDALQGMVDGAVGGGGASRAVGDAVWAAIRERP